MARDDRVTEPPGGRRVPEVPLPDVPWRPGQGLPPRGLDPTPPDRAVDRGADLFDAGFWWEAHEVWEGVWVGLPKGTAERGLLQALVQAAAYQIKVRDGLPDAAERLRQRALGRLDEGMAAHGDVLHGLDLRRLREDLAAHRSGDPPLQLRDALRGPGRRLP